jgi:hypothetical protein
MSLFPLTLGNVQSEVTLELGPPARDAVATSTLRSIGPTVSRPTSAVGAMVSSSAVTAVAFLCPPMEGDGDHDDAHHDHHRAQEYRPTWGTRRVTDGGQQPFACEREGCDHGSRELGDPWTRDGRREREQDHEIGASAQ